MTGKFVVKYVPTYTKGTLKKRSAKGLSNDADAIFFSDFLYKSICCGYSFELHHAIQMGTHNISLYQVEKKYTSCNLKTTELLECALIGVHAVIRLNRVVYSTTC